MNEPDQGSVVLIDLGYSDQVQSKLRPALIISNSEINRISRDVIVMKITSKEPRFRKVRITREDLLTGTLAYESYVQIDAIHTVEKTIIREIIGVLNKGKLQEIKNHIPFLFALDSSG